MIHCFSTPIGIIRLKGDGNVITSLELGVECDTLAVSSGEVFLCAERQILEYFEGKRRDFDIPYSLCSTEFQIDVWNAVRGIPYGSVMSYGEVARRANRPNAYRAVGSAMRVNPLPLIIPCHRVVSSGGIGGFRYGLEIKRRLLGIEGCDIR